MDWCIFIVVCLELFLWGVNMNSFDFYKSFLTSRLSTLDARLNLRKGVEELISVISE